MNHELISTALTGGLLLGFWWLIFFEGRDYWIDRTRQTLFKIRDDLFDRAAEDAGITFEDEAYGIARTTINGMIQFTHDISLARVISVLIFYRHSRRREHVRQYNSDFQSAIEKLPKEGRQVVLRAMADMHLATLRHMIHTSIFLFPILVPLILILHLTHRMKKARRWALRGPDRRDPWDIIDTAAKCIGERSAVCH